MGQGVAQLRSSLARPPSLRLLPPRLPPGPRMGRIPRSAPARLFIDIPGGPDFVLRRPTTPATSPRPRLPDLGPSRTSASPPTRAGLPPVRPPPPGVGLFLQLGPPGVSSSASGRAPRHRPPLGRLEPHFGWAAWRGHRPKYKLQPGVQRYLDQKEKVCIASSPGRLSAVRSCTLDALLLPIHSVREEQRQDRTWQQRRALLVNSVD